MTRFSRPISAAGLGLVLLLTAACGSTSTAAPANSSAGTTAMTSAGSTASSSAPSSSAAASGSAASSPAAASGDAATPSPTATVGDSTGTLDAAGTTWFTALCTGLSPLAAESAKIADALGAGATADKISAAAPTLLAIGTLYSDTGTALAGLPAPGFPGGADYATAAIASFGELGTTFTGAGTAAQTGDGSKIASLRTDLTSGPGVTALAGLAVAPETKTAINAIPICASSGVMQ